MPAPKSVSLLPEGRDSRRSNGHKRGGGKRSGGPTPEGRRRPSPRSKRTGSGSGVPGVASRELAIDAMIRIEKSGAYANLVLPDMLDRSSLSAADRRFVTELVYGATRMQRACDHLYDRFLVGEVDDQVRAGLRIGTYQLCYLRTPAHAAVDATVGAVRSKGRSVVNAVLRRVATSPIEFPSDAIRLSYPDWIMDEFTAFLGRDRALAALEAMNRPAVTAVRQDGYVQDPASQLVVAATGVGPGDLTADVCAAPGGKATGMAHRGATVIAADRRASRVGLIADNTRRLGLELPLIVSDARTPPLRPRSLDHVLVDAPCSGFGSFRRRPDARWRIEQEAPERLGELQRDILAAAFELVRPDGVVTYSVCTFGRVEGDDVVRSVLDAEPDAELLDPRPEPWLIIGTMSVLLPDNESDGMMLAQLRRRQVR